MYFCPLKALRSLAVQKLIECFLSPTFPKFFAQETLFYPFFTLWETLFFFLSPILSHLVLSPCI